MPVKNISLTKEARKRFFEHVIDISAANVAAKGFVNYLNDIKITGISFVYSVATDGGTTPEAIQVGTAATADKYFTGAPTASQALGVVQRKTVLNPTVLLPAGTALIVNKSAATGGTNTGEVTVIVEYEQIDKDASGG